MIASDSGRAARMRRDTWRRRHDRRNAGPAAASTAVGRPPVQLAELLVSLSRGWIGSEAARDIVAVAHIEVVVDAECGRVERWMMVIGGGATGGDADAGTTTIAPAA